VDWLIADEIGMSTNIVFFPNLCDAKHFMNTRC
jgi:hypothetical protein